MVVFDEEDHELMAIVADKVSAVVQDVFPPTLEENSVDATLKIGPAHSSKWQDLEPCFKLLETTLGELYTKIDGSNWKKDKIVEFKEPGLVYIMYYTESEELVAFVSVKLCLHYKVKKLYLYEINISPQYQGKGLGPKLMKYVQSLARRLDHTRERILSCKGVNLTVFTENERALGLYESLGYKLTRESLTPMKLDDGRTVKPVYYLMERPNDRNEPKN